MTDRKTLRPQIDYSKCTGCMDCVTFCPFSCLELNVTGKDRYGTLFPGLTAEGENT